MKKIVYIAFFIFFIAQKLLAQDIHYSQFFTSPISLNPAKTGLFNGDWRIGANYKNQWNSIPVAYNTGSIFVDFALGEKRNSMIKKAGVGIFLAQDVAGDGNLSTTKIQLSGAFHQVLDENEKYFLSFGFSGGYVQKHIDFTKLYWGNQWDGTQFNTVLNAKEPFKAALISYPTINAGVEFSAILAPNKFVHSGLAFYQINRPTETFYQSENSVGIKPVLNLGGSFGFNYEYELFTEFYFSYQKTATEADLSVIVGKNVSDSKFIRVYVYAGLMYRLKDAMMPVVGFSKNNLRVYLNYDVNLSGLTPYSTAQGGIEFSVQYTYEKERGHHFRRRLPCSVF